jgi:catechol 2,3-dioxygenase-like lactoylglutathione lyase family enzyme
MDGISHLVVESSDLKRGVEFYRHLGFAAVDSKRLPNCGDHALLQMTSGQLLVLSRNEQPRSLPETGTHQAYRVTPRERDAIGEKLTAAGVPMHRYKEDRPVESSDNFYFFDPDGNRIQLVASSGSPDLQGKVLGIDHAAIESHDLEWAEDFYVKRLGWTAENRVGWRTEDYARAKLWGEGKEDMAPGTRRWDRRYTTMEQKRLLPRPNTQLFVRIGDGTLGIFLATQHRQEAPEEQIIGTPRVGVRTSRAVLEKTATLLAETRSPAEGPVEHPSGSPIALSLYVRDPGGNFIELCVLR